MAEKKTLDETWDDADVEAIYQAYPRQVGKLKAHTAIRKALARVETPASGNGESVFFLLEKTRKYAASDVGQGKCFNAPPYPATWFNQGRYDDDPKEWQCGTNTAGRPGEEPGKYDGLG